MKHTLTLILLCLALGAKATDRGFRHPGGLHTEADFERVRQQLAEGNELVTAAYAVLCAAEYAQSTVTTYPTETIYRGSNENYINAARGATMAYQNALRWRIGGNTACAKHAVEILMNWAETTTAISGTSDQCLAAGLYGYEFAQAAELMRDYEGWDAADFETFKAWMLRVWYPKAIGFLRERNGTWENSSKWWQCPGHYWSNWGLCNALCVMSIGVLCDDVYIYNQGVSFFKHDQVGTFVDPRVADPILNDGLTEFLGNLVVTTSESELETGAYGKLGQMNESGRDTGHASMALGLAVDVAKQGWNQGDDLFAYMDHRLAAGIEYVAAQMLSVEGLPWTNYHYATNGYYYTDSRSWLMTEPCLGEQIRPYWGTVIGHYEGVKGVEMPYSSQCLSLMGIDGGGTGSTSGGYDHLGYSVLMNTRDGLAPTDSVPTELTPYILYNSKTYQQSELGGLVNTYTNSGTTAVATGQSLTLWAELPDGEEDTGLWQWNTGETTQAIETTTDQSYAYRVTYTNARGAKSEQLFTIAVKGDCEDCQLTPYYTVSDETTTGETDVMIESGSSLTLGVTGCGWDTYKWSTGSTSSSITISSQKKERTVTCTVTSHGGKTQTVTFNIWLAYDLASDSILALGNYQVRHRLAGTLLTNEGIDSTPTFEEENTDAPETQTWYLYRSSTTKPYYELQSLVDGSTLNIKGTMVKKLTSRPWRVYFADGKDYAAIAAASSSLASSATYYYLAALTDGSIDLSHTSLFGFPYTLTLVDSDEETGVASVPTSSATATDYYDLTGRRVFAPTRGLYIKGGKKIVLR